MDKTKVRKLTANELAKEIAKTQAQVVELRAEIILRRVKNMHALRAVKHYLAQLLTIAQEREIIKTLGNE